MREYANIELETTMSSASVYRATPYEFAVTAEPGQIVVKCGQEVSGSSHVIPISAVEPKGSDGFSLPFDIEVAPRPPALEEYSE